MEANTDAIRYAIPLVGVYDNYKPVRAAEAVKQEKPEKRCDSFLKEMISEIYEMLVRDINAHLYK